MRARVIGGLPADLVGSLTGLTQGRFPVARQVDLRRRAARLASASKQLRARARTPRTSSSRTAPAARSASSAARARRSSPSTTAASSRHRPLAQARQLHRAAGRLRQHLPLLGPRASSPRPTRSQASARRRGGELALPERGAAPQGRRLAFDEGRPRRHGEAAAEVAHGRRRPQAGRQGAPRARPPRAAAACRRPLPAKERLFAHPARPNSRDRRAAHDRARADAQPRPERRDPHHGRPPPRPAQLRRQAAQEGRPRHRRDRARPHRQDERRAGAARPLRDPPGRPRRPADRPEADPRRLEAARVDRDLPLQEAQPVLRRRRRGSPRSARSC